MRLENAWRPHLKDQAGRDWHPGFSASAAILLVFGSFAYNPHGSLAGVLVAGVAFVLTCNVSACQFQNREAGFKWAMAD
jgi:hypothetical protein